ncbi:MAG: 2Fe-2S iron-sulfur cluster-binding protein [Candidatus Cybelea sp.]
MLSRRRFFFRAAISALAAEIGLRFRAAAKRPILHPNDPPAPALPAHTITIDVNGVERTLTVEPRVTLLDALRDCLGLTGTKKGCDQGTCGACTVMVNDRRIDSCLTLAVMHAGDRVVTVEGIAQNGTLHPVQRAFITHDGFQCGFCTPGQIVSAVALLNEGKRLDRDTIRTEMSGNLCRCGCYPHIVDAVLEAAGAS